MRENTESPVHVYQEIDSVDTTVDYDVVKSDPGDQLELDILIYPPVFPCWLTLSTLCVLSRDGMNC